MPQDAVASAQRTFDISLDYSEGSVQQAETVLAKLFGTIPKGTIGKLFERQSVVSGIPGHSPRQVHKFGLASVYAIVRSGGQSVGAIHTP